MCWTGKKPPPGRVGLEHAIHHHDQHDHHAVEVQMGVQQRAKAVEEDHGAEAGRRTGADRAYVPLIGASLPHCTCEQHERTVGNDNCVSFDRMGLQLRADELR